MDKAINNFNSNLHLNDVNRRRNTPMKKNGKTIHACINCGVLPAVHRELGACATPDCVKMMRKVKRWSDSILAAQTKTFNVLRQGEEQR